MLYELSDGKLITIEDNNINLDKSKKYIALTKSADALSICDKFDISQQTIEKEIIHKTARFESHDNLDIICTPLINFSTSEKAYDNVFFFVKLNTVLIICNNIENFTPVFDCLLDNNIKNINISKLIYEFFEGILEKNQRHLDKIELSIIKFEEEILHIKKNKNYIHKLATLRKQLLHLKKYYEQIMDILNDIEENENGIFDEYVLKSFRIISGKADRLYHSVLNLRDYVTQIREAYQAEEDISLNTTMKIFTVVSTIFFPLTLIVGWYGMNFNMPEFHSVWGYPSVIALCIIVVTSLILYFKKQNWF